MENWIFLGMSAAIFASYQKLYRKMTAKNEFARPASTQIKCFKTFFLMCVFILFSSASFCEYADFSNWHFPSPPQQSIVWNPGATTLSNEVILAMRQLFELGLADPRGCEYKTVQVETGSVWAHCPILITTRGWVLPESPNSECFEKRYQGDDIFWPKEDTIVEFSIGDLLCQFVCELTYTAKFRVFWPQPVKEFARKRCFDIWFGD